MIPHGKSTNDHGCPAAMVTGLIDTVGYDTHPVGRLGLRAVGRRSGFSFAESQRRNHFDFRA